MPRTTLDDRARKARLLEREIMRLRRQYDAIESLSDTDYDTLKTTVTNVRDAADKGAPLTTETLTNWRELRSMGVVRVDRSGTVMVSTIGKEILEAEEA